MTRTIAIGLAVFLAACTAPTPGGHIDGFNAAATTPGATAAASARTGASHAIVTPGTVAGAMASGRAK